MVENSYWNPVNMLRSDVFPAPEGPIIAVNSPDLNIPETPLITCFFSETTNISKLMNSQFASIYVN